MSTNSPPEMGCFITLPLAFAHFHVFSTISLNLQSVTNQHACVLHMYMHETVKVLALSIIPVIDLLQLFLRDPSICISDTLLGFEVFFDLHLNKVKVPTTFEEHSLQFCPSAINCACSCMQVTGHRQLDMNVINSIDASSMLEPCMNQLILHKQVAVRSISFIKLANFLTAALVVLCVTPNPRNMYACIAVIINQLSYE